ncbi:MAG: flagellar hook-basal body complex protein FliE [Nitrospirota bacterium]|jgi:flagellar hook-basal body complex protein FliE|nr:flagellar hook-basal body complex protein FliE [Nitrospirota bacterium]MDH5574403.1 flagellar hook-basal body complex protein FliE [Nitrospirota bacterium]
MDHVTLKGIEGIPEPFGVTPLKGTSKQGPGFGDLLKQAVESVNAMQHEAGRLQEGVANGENVNIHQAVIAGEKAGLSFKLLMQVRNKMLDAYQEIMRMQV